MCIVVPRPDHTSSRTVACWRQLPVPVFRVCGLPSGTQCCTPLLQPLYPPSYILQLLLYCVWLGQADTACEAHSTTMCVCVWMRSYCTLSLLRHWEINSSLSTVTVYMCRHPTISSQIGAPHSHVRTYVCTHMYAIWHQVNCIKPPVKAPFNGVLCAYV